MDQLPARLLTMFILNTSGLRESFSHLYNWAICFAGSSKLIIYKKVYKRSLRFYKTDAEISGVFILFILIIWLEGKSLSPEIGDANGE